jgi:RNA:NAD 2'-phosphotransferase (TPT1/KptA family)
MGRRKNDGLGRLGGRSLGTPNRISACLREWLAALIDENREQIKKDLTTLEPKERLAVLEKFISYILPKAKEEGDTHTDDNVWSDMWAAVDEINSRNQEEYDKVKKNF